MSGTLPILDDTIAAIATPPGAGGLAVVRVSGRAAIEVADRVFAGGMRLDQAASHTLHHGWARWPADVEPSLQRRLDEVVAAVFRAPRSYTREHVIELSCHGGELPSRRVLAALLAAGARLARPGEFTLRAFLNGRLDLTRAEAVADVIAAASEAASDLALAQLSGALSLRLDALHDRICDALAEIEARVDFAEDVGGVEVPPAVISSIDEVASELGAMLAGSSYARAIREGVRVPLIGRPNVGKSSLFNALLGEARAIVTPLPGTTRDRVSEAIELAGIRVTLSDTAGIRATRDPIEALGVERSRGELNASPLAVWVVDASQPLTSEDFQIASALAGRRSLVALNKSDLDCRVGSSEVAELLSGGPSMAVPVSALHGAGVDALREALATALGATDGALGEAVSNPRHAEALARAQAAVVRAGAAGRASAPGECVALELREALAAIGEVTGRSVSEELLDRIFSRFCIGK
ncbi:MAG: tRNA uridine-5-carboxymethylaminomethyl(34) synthesis GTPase MnmE [Candidatus Eisenbacteria bacterium]|uniref:tRNA modification GTPase MnmE n=1 Tax=Eiseniibacteriota bacterium TaxID=2212470 RepID=A0A849SIN1_UNCEI|nr:tRNA uridine-5-carboxymethylaminomethyl(34) synthesis GTPase MnmE [Candidatus Eisenbacteria bacterium]